MSAPTAVPRTKNRGVRRDGPAVKVFRVVNVLLLTGFALICLVPFLNVIGSSFANPGELATRPFVIIPREPTLNAYEYVLSSPSIFRAMGVSVFVTWWGRSSACWSPRSWRTRSRSGICAGVA